MIVPNEISEEITQQKIDTVMAAVRSIYTELPFLVGLTGKERLRLNKAGDASQAFIRKSADVADLIEPYLRRGFDVAEMRKDIEAMDALQVVGVAVSQLAEMLSDTRAVVASEAYSAALEVYSCAKKAQGNAGMDELVAELGRRFARSNSAETDETDDEQLEEPAPAQ